MPNDRRSPSVPPVLSRLLEMIERCPPPRLIVERGRYRVILPPPKPPIA
jgi:hypothetical protein